MKTQTIGGVALPTLDIGVLADPADHMPKVPCELTIQPGSGGYNVLRQARDLGAAVDLVALVGEDQVLARIVTAKIREQFPEARVVTGLAETRVSILLGERCYSRRPTLAIDTLPYEVLAGGPPWDIVLIPPMAAGQRDFGLVRWLLHQYRHSRTVLMLSREQIAQRDAALDAMRAAGMVVLNHEELAGFTGSDDWLPGIRRLREEGVRNILVTTRTCAVGYLDGQWVHQPAFQTKVIRSTIGSGDRFLGGVLGARAAGDSWEEALRVGLATAAMYLEGEPPRSLAEAKAFARARSTVPLRPPSRSFTHRAVAAASLLLALLATVVGWVVS